MMLEETTRCLSRWKKGPFLPLFLTEDSSQDGTQWCTAPAFLNTTWNEPARDLACSWGWWSSGPSPGLGAEVWLWAVLCCVLWWLCSLYPGQANASWATGLVWHLCSVLTAQGKAGTWPLVALRCGLPLGLCVRKVIQHQKPGSNTQAQGRWRFLGQVTVWSPRRAWFSPLAAVSEQFHSCSFREILRGDGRMEGSCSPSSVLLFVSLQLLLWAGSSGGSDVPSDLCQLELESPVGRNARC